MQSMFSTSHMSTYAEPTVSAVLELLYICSWYLLTCYGAVVPAHAFPCTAKRSEQYVNSVLVPLQVPATWQS